MKQWINLKKGFHEHYGQHAKGMADMLDALGLDLVCVRVVRYCCFVNVSGLLSCLRGFDGNT